MEELSPAFFNSLQLLKNDGFQLIFVHGGGPEINKLLTLHEVPTQFVNGLRKTTKEVLGIAEMALAGSANRKIVDRLSSLGFKAIGLNGSDAGLLKGSVIDEENLGLVGEIDQVQTELIEVLLAQDLLPVITPIAIGENGAKLNVNADFAAAAVAAAINADHCIFVTDVEGIFINGKRMEMLDVERAESYIKTEEISGGMIPKVKSAIAALDKGLDKVMIVSGKQQFFTGTGWIGTEICLTKEEALQ